MYAEKIDFEKNGFIKKIIKSCHYDSSKLKTTFNDDYMCCGDDCYHFNDEYQESKELLQEYLSLLKESNKNYVDSLRVNIANMKKYFYKYITEDKIKDFIKNNIINFQLTEDTVLEFEDFSEFKYEVEDGYVDVDCNIYSLNYDVFVKLELRFGNFCMIVKNYTSNNDIICENMNNLFMDYYSPTSLETNLDEQYQDFLIDLIPKDLKKTYSYLEYPSTKLEDFEKIYLTYKEVYDKILADTEVKQKETTTNKKNDKKKRRNNNMKFNMGKMFEECGEVKGGELALTMNGQVAVRRGDGDYVRYDFATNQMQSQGDFVIKGNSFMFLIPVPQVNVGDIIKNKGKYYQVLEVNQLDGSMRVVSIEKGTKTKLLKEVSMFGFSFTLKVISLMDSMSNQTTMGMNPMLLMALSKSKDDNMEDNEDMDISQLLMFSLMGNQGQNQMNPMLMMAMMNGEKDMLPMLMMSGMMGNQNGMGMFNQQTPQMVQQPQNMPLSKTDSKKTKQEILDENELLKAQLAKLLSQKKEEENKDGDEVQK